MKKVLCAMLAAVMVTMSLTSCGDNGGSSSDASPSDSQSSASALKATTPLQILMAPLQSLFLLPNTVGWPVSLTLQNKNAKKWV